MLLVLCLMMVVKSSIFCNVILEDAIFERFDLEKNQIRRGFRVMDGYGTGPFCHIY